MRNACCCCCQHTLWLQRCKRQTDTHIDALAVKAWACHVEAVSVRATFMRQGAAAANKLLTKLHHNVQ